MRARRTYLSPDWCSIAGCPKCCLKDDALRILIDYILTYSWYKLLSSPHFTVICLPGPHFLGLFFWHWGAGANIVLSWCGWSSLRRNFDEVDMVTDIGVRYDSKAWGWFQQSLWFLKLGILQTVCFLKQNWTHEWHMSGTSSSHQGPSTSTKGSPCHAPLPGSTPKDCSGQPSGCTGCTPIVPISPGFPWGISCVKFSDFLSTGSWGAVSHFARTLWKKRRNGRGGMYRWCSFPKWWISRAWPFWSCYM